MAEISYHLENTITPQKALRLFERGLFTWQDLIDAVGPVPTHIDLLWASLKSVQEQIHDIQFKRRQRNEFVDELTQLVAIELTITSALNLAIKFHISLEAC